MKSSAASQSTVATPLAFPIFIARTPAEGATPGPGGREVKTLQVEMPPHPPFVA